MTFLFSACGSTVEEIPKNKIVQEVTPTPTKKQDIPATEEIVTNTKPKAEIIDKLIRENGVLINFSGGAYDADDDQLSFKWQEGETLLSTKKDFTKNDFSEGEHNITFTVTDAHGESDSDTMTITILPSNDTNDIPILLDQNIVTDEDQEVSFTIEADDVEGDPLTMIVTSNPIHGTLNGIFPNLTYTPNENFRGSDTVRYKVNDGNSDSNEATVYILIRTVNDTPLVNAGEDQKIKIGHETWVSGNATDSDGEIIKYEWKESNKILSDQPTFKYKPQTVGIHELTLTATDNENATTSDRVSINVTNKLPLVIIRIEFNDYKFHSDASVWSQKIFGTGDGELNHYYNEISYGKLQFEKAIETQATTNDGIITVSLNENHPNDVDDFPNRIVEAIQLTNSYINYAQYDTDHNNAISRDELQVMFLVAGGERSTGLSPGIWAHAWCMYGGNTNAPTLDGVKLMECSTDGWYSRFGESHFQHGTDATIGIIAHELGHSALGLPDLYDTDLDGVSEGIGNFGLMGAGNWGKKSITESPGMTPTHMTGWSKMQSGFVDPIVIENNSSTLEFRGTSYIDYQLYKITTQRSGEYFLVENRTNNGYDRGLSLLKGNTFTGGLSILHIDDNVYDNNDETHKLVDIEEANNVGLDTGEHRGHTHNLYFSGNVDSFTPTTTPNSNLYNARSSGISITNISDNGASMFADIEIQ